MRFVVSSMVRLAALTSSIAVLCVVHIAAQPSRSSLALVGGKIYVAPSEPAVTDGVVVMVNGKISQVGHRAQVHVPGDAIILDCTGLVVTAGFQNSHVHFTEDKWADAGNQPAATLTADLRGMFVRYGFTTVVDTGSLLSNTVALRRRIESGELAGPRILTAGLALYPPNGIPYYVKDATPPDLLKLLPQPTTTADVLGAVQRNFEGGADLVKLFTGSSTSRQQVVPMPLDVATAAAMEAHRRGKLVFTHPSNLAGLEVALAAQVDVLAHAVEATEGLSPGHLRQMKQHNMALIPTLKLFGGVSRIDPSILREVGDYLRLGGQILFGTDVGYIPDYDPLDEFEAMARAGLTWQQILASLTTDPAARFRESSRRGRVAAGMDADLIVLGSDPATTIRAFVDVRHTIRSGHVIYP